MNAPISKSIHRLKEEGACWNGGAIQISSQILNDLHKRLGKDNQNVRLEIDSYLLASYYSTQSDSLKSEYVLDICDTYHYFNLPDLLPHLKICLSNNQWNSSLIGVYLAVFCLQLKKTKKYTTIPNVQEISAILNVMHGTLLGLYPYNIKQHQYTTRSKIAGKMHKLLTNKNNLIFLKKHDALLQLCVIEYMINVVLDFCIVEHNFLIKNAHLRFTLNQIFETFRASVETYIDSDSFFEELNNKALYLLPTIFRQLKLMCCKVPKKLCNYKYYNKYLNFDKSVLLEDTLKSYKVTACDDNLIAQAKLLFPNKNFEELQLIEYIWKSINIFVLPTQIVNMQMAHCQKFSACSIFKNSLVTLHVCLYCALKSKFSVFNQKFAYNCVTGELHCSSCSKMVSAINLLGRVLTIKNFSYYLCGSCLNISIWNGDDLLSCPLCKQKPQTQPFKTCLICMKKPSEILNNVIDVPNLRFVQTPLCYQHSRRAFFSPDIVLDVKMLNNELYNIH